MSRIVHFVSKDGLFNFAITSGAFYDEHKRLAGFHWSKAKEQWENHIRRNLLPRYALEFKEPTASLDRDDLDGLTLALHAYYVKHLSEGTPKAKMRAPGMRFQSEQDI